MHAPGSSARRLEILIADPPDLSSKGMRQIGCNDIGPVYAARPWPVNRSMWMDECEDYYESEVFMLRRGELWAARDDIGHAHTAIAPI